MQHKLKVMLITYNRLNILLIIPLTLLLTFIGKLHIKSFGVYIFPLIWLSINDASGLEIRST